MSLPNAERAIVDPAKIRDYLLSTAHPVGGFGILTRDVPHAGLRPGDLGAIVEVYGPNAFEVEFVAASGRTQALVTLSADDLRHVHDDDLISVRTLERATG